MIAYDQYQRYKTISTVVEKIKAKFGLKKVKILEVGANAQKNLGKFLTDDEIFYTDLEVPEGFEDDDHFFVADATNLVGIKEESYDVIIASDVFEHIPKELREKFERYKVLVSKNELSDAEYEEIDKLEFYLDEIPDYLAKELTAEYSRLKLEFSNRG